MPKARSRSRPRPDDVVLAVMGPTGVGKSSFIKRVTGYDYIKVSHSLHTGMGDTVSLTGGLRLPESSSQEIPVDLSDRTSKVTPYHITLQSPGDFRHRAQTLKITILDCPGFDDPSTPDQTTITSILEFLDSSNYQGKKLHGIIYMLDICNIRLRGVDRRNIVMFQQLCGVDFYSNVVLCTTHWDQLQSSAEGIQREKELWSNPLFFGEFAAKGSKHRRLMIREDGENADDMRVVLDIARKHHPRMLRAQEEMEEGVPPSETRAVREENVWNLYLTQQREQLQERLRQAQDEMQQQLRQNEEMVRREFDNVEAAIFREHEDERMQLARKVKEMEFRRRQLPQRLKSEAEDAEDDASESSPNLEEEEEEEKEDDDDDAGSSVVTGSSATLVPEVLAAANEFISLLLGDQDLNSLLSEAFDHIDGKLLQEKIRRQLKSFASDLGQEAHDDIEKDAVRLVWTRARYVAYCIRQHYDTSISNGGSEYERLKVTISGRRTLLDDYLRGRTTQGMDSTQPKPDVDNGNTSDSGSEAEMDEPELDELGKVKVFIYESAAYHKFKQALKESVLPPKEPTQQASISVDVLSLRLLHKWRRVQSKAAEVICALRMLLRPSVPPEHRRITWICGCGDHRYADVREYRPNSASAIQTLLRRSAAAMNVHGESSGTPDMPRPPDQAYVPGTPAEAVRVSIGDIQSPGNVNSGGVGSAPLNATASSSAVGSSAISSDSDPVLLLLCITLNGSSMLEQLDITDLGNDQYLWERIRGRYLELRRKTLWHQKLSITSWLSTHRWSSWLLKIMDLTSAHSIQFVRFQLVPIAMDIRPWNFHSPSLPPETEVKVKKTYHYNPCPAEVDPTGLNSELLHCLWKPGPHLDRFWLDFFPKKLKEALWYASSKPEVNTGWGVRIVEGTNWASVTLLALVLFSFSAILGIICSVITHDIGAAFSISAFVAVLPTLGVTLLQLRPNE
ncbi:hypothetical protein H2200_000577 [Cladophialophora chaetospira]|uniref:G domain-containing protein n=1 Tax=Cladophialophora chaetospira TaxID=386627 RepID=A0AA39CQG5_9EURO|nr:hypothetical protein H2200_000577 [Cladophialophora chaetospira]